jgi:peptide chain release factor
MQNKTSSAVQLKHLPTGLVTKSQATRSRSQNRKIARRLLAERLEEMEKGPESRRAVKAEIARKRKASKTKKAKRKYRNLDGGNGAIGTGEDESVDGELSIRVKGLRAGDNEGIMGAGR